MIPKSGYRFSDEIMLKSERWSMIPKSGYRFSDEIMQQDEDPKGKSSCEEVHSNDAVAPLARRPLFLIDTP
jgi:hypothetical protein